MTEERLPSESNGYEVVKRPVPKRRFHRYPWVEDLIATADTGQAIRIQATANPALDSIRACVSRHCAIHGLDGHVQRDGDDLLLWATRRAGTRRRGF